MIVAQTAFVLTKESNTSDGREPGIEIMDSVSYVTDMDLYYSDLYFSQPSTEYDPHLATLSMFMADASKAKGCPKDVSDTEWYENQSQGLRRFFDAIGFGSFACNEDYRTRTAFDTIGVGVAMKSVTINGEDYTIVGLTVRSGGYYIEWANNVWLGDGSKSDYMHEGWHNAANKALAFLSKYLEDNEVTGNLKLWISGFSRGGATTNILAGLLDNHIERGSDVLPSAVSLKHEDLYAYTFEAPQGANINSKSVISPRDGFYDNIWNILNPNDLVPKVPMSEWGFTRFGTDLFITTEFFDPVNYDSNRATFRAMYEQGGYDPSQYCADDITMSSIPVES